MVRMHSHWEAIHRTRCQNNLGLGVSVRSLRNCSARHLLLPVLLGGLRLGLPGPQNILGLGVGVRFLRGCPARRLLLPVLLGCLRLGPQSPMLEGCLGWWFA